MKKLMFCKVKLIQTYLRRGSFIGNIERTAKNKLNETNLPT